MAQTAMTVRMDNQQKAQFDKLCEQFGMSANTAINIFVKAVIRSKSIPFSIQAKNEEEDEVTAKAKAAFQYMCDTARENNIDMSLDEINEEIREVRRLRKERNGICVNQRQNVTTDFQQLAHPTFFKKSILLIGIARAANQAALTFTFLFEL